MKTQPTPTTGFLCEYSDSDTPICAANATVEISRIDDEEHEAYCGYYCADHTGDRHALALWGYELHTLPEQVMAGV